MRTVPDPAQGQQDSVNRNVQSAGQELRPRSPDLENIHKREPSNNVPVYTNEDYGAEIFLPVGHQGPVHQPGTLR